MNIDIMKAACCAGGAIEGKIIGLAKFLKVISEDNRLKILCLLRDGELCVCEIVESLGLPQSLVSAHLKGLKDVGLVDSRQEWKRVYYSINKSELLKYTSLLGDFLQTLIRDK